MIALLMRFIAATARAWKIEPKGAQSMTTAASREDQVLNQQERESDDCAGCPFAGVNTCRNQCHEVTAIYNPNLTH